MNEEDGLNPKRWTDEELEAAAQKAYEDEPDLMGQQLGVPKLKWEELREWQKESWRCEVDETRDLKKVLELAKEEGNDNC